MSEPRWIQMQDVLDELEELETERVAHTVGRHAAPPGAGAGPEAPTRRLPAAPGA